MSVPLYDLEAEMGVIGSILLLPDCYANIAGKINASDFYDDANKEIYDTIAEMVLNGDDIDVMLLAAKLRTKGVYEKIGGAAYVAKISGAVPNAGHVVSYADIVSEKAQCRQLKAALSAAIEDIDAGEITVDVAAKVKTEATACATDRNQAATNAVDLLDSVVASIEAGEKEIIFDGGSAFPNFEFGPEKITIVGAPPGTGKTTLASQVCFEALKRHDDIRLQIANAEMSDKMLIRREIARVAAVPMESIRRATLTPDELERVRAAHQTMRPLFDRTTVIPPPYTLDSLLRLQYQQPGIVVVDYLQKFTPRDVDSLTGLAMVLDALRTLAKYGWCVVALSATARLQKTSKTRSHDSNGLDLGSFRGSGDIEFNADHAYILRDKTDNDEATERDMSLDCLKNRHGPRHKIKLFFSAKDMSFFAPAPERYSEFDAYEFTEGPMPYE